MRLNVTNHRRASVLLLGLLAASCAVADAPQVRQLRSAKTYAWDGQPPAAGTVEALTRSLIDAELHRLGYSEAGARTADLKVAQRLSVTRRPRSHHPEFTLHTESIEEVGELSVELRAIGGALLWEGAESQFLRTVSRGFGVDKVRFRETGDPRGWRAQELVASALAGLPARN